MKKLLIAGLVLFSILLSPLASTSFDAVAGRTAAGDGGEECACGMPAPPICYDEATGQRCDTDSGGSTLADDGGSNQETTDLPTDRPTVLMMMLVAAYLTSRAIQYP